MEEEKLLYPPSTARIWVFRLWHHFFFTCPLFIVILFRFRPPLTIFCDNKKKTLRLWDEKSVFMVRWEERNKFSLSLMETKKKEPFRCRRVGIWDPMTSRRVEMNNKYYAGLWCNSSFFFTVCLSGRVMRASLKGNSFEMKKKILLGALYIRHLPDSRRRPGATVSVPFCLVKPTMKMGSAAGVNT